MVTTVTRETTETLCTKCQAEPRRKGQRWGNKCFAASQRKWAKNNTQLRRDLRKITAKHFPRQQA